VNHKKLPSTPPAANHHLSSPKVFPIEPSKITVSK
jgi:hypothetical protein